LRRLPIKGGAAQTRAVDTAECRNAEYTGDATMKNKKTFLAKLWRDIRGISSVEYALLLAFIAVGIVVAAGNLSEAVTGKIDETANCITSSALCS
jgi:Flp pilus assembly pilin Flp